jgi:hypothetical protein
MQKKKSSLQYEHLKELWSKRHKEIEKEIFEKHKDSFQWLSENSKQFAVGSLAGLFLLTSPITPKIPSSFSTASAEINTSIDKRVFLVYDLKSILPQEVRSLTPEEEKSVSEVLTRDFGISVTPELEGKRLNTSYGYIGQEQHLARYPGDTMLSHFEDAESADSYFKYGMAPGLGAWRYFADSKESMTQKDVDREKYYIAVQTFLAPGFSENVREYVNFFKYRKMLVVNPQNGKAMVVVIGDAGPAKWTGKSLGGSPEVMRYLERVDGSQKGPVLYYFIDDPDDKIPLGPIN